MTDSGEKFFGEQPLYANASAIVRAHRGTPISGLAPLRRAMLNQLKRSLSAAEKHFVELQNAEDIAAEARAALSTLDAEIEALAGELSPSEAAAA